MNVKELIEKLQGVDGGLEVVAEFEGRVYSVHGRPEVKLCQDGEIYDNEEQALECGDNDTVKCLVLETLF